MWQAKNKANRSRIKSNVASAMAKVWAGSEYYLNLESEDKKRYKEKLTFSNGEHFARSKCIRWKMLDGRKKFTIYLIYVLQTFLII